MEWGEWSGVCGEQGGVCEWDGVCEWSGVCEQGEVCECVCERVGCCVCGMCKWVGYKIILRIKFHSTIDNTCNTNIQLTLNLNPSALCLIVFTTEAIPIPSNMS